MRNRLIFAAATLVIIAYGGWRYTQTGTDAGNGGPLVQVSVPQLTAAEQEGEALFNANCVTCHGENAAGRDGSGPPLVHVIYEPNHHSDEAFYFAVKNGARAHHWPFGNMQPVEGVSEADVTKIITYVRALQRENGIR